MTLTMADALPTIAATLAATVPLHDRNAAALHRLAGDSLQTVPLQATDPADVVEAVTDADRSLRRPMVAGITDADTLRALLAARISPQVDAAVLANAALPDRDRIIRLADELDRAAPSRTVVSAACRNVKVVPTSLTSPTLIAKVAAVGPVSTGSANGRLLATAALADTSLSPRLIVQCTLAAGQPAKGSRRPARDQFDLHAAAGDLLVARAIGSGSPNYLPALTRDVLDLHADAGRALHPALASRLIDALATLRSPHAEKAARTLLAATSLADAGYCVNRTSAAVLAACGWKTADGVPGPVYQSTVLDTVRAATAAGWTLDPGKTVTLLVDTHQKPTDADGGRLVWPSVAGWIAAHEPLRRWALDNADTHPSLTHVLEHVAPGLAEAPHARTIVPGAMLSHPAVRFNYTNRKDVEALLADVVGQALADLPCDAAVLFRLLATANGSTRSFNDLLDSAGAVAA